MLDFEEEHKKNVTMNTTFLPEKVKIKHLIDTNCPKQKMIEKGKK